MTALAGLNTIESYLSSEWNSILSLGALSQVQQFFASLDPSSLYPTALGSTQIVLSDTNGNTVTINGSGFSLTLTSITQLESINSLQGALQILSSSAGGAISSIVMTSNGAQVAQLSLSPSLWVATAGSETLTIKGDLPVDVATVATGLSQLFTSSGQLNPGFYAPASILSNYSVSAITLANAGATQASLNWSGSTLTATTGDYSIAISGNLPQTMADLGAIAVKQNEGGGTTGFTLGSGVITQISTGQTIASLNFNGADFGSNDILSGATGSIFDTADNISASLDALNGIGGAIVITDNGTVGVSDTQLSQDSSAISRLQNANGSAYTLALTYDSHLVTDFDAVNANSHIASITLTAPLTGVIPALFVTGGAKKDTVALGKITNPVFSIVNIVGGTQAFYLNGGSANVVGGGETVVFFGGANNSASLSGTFGSWDTVTNANGATGAVYLANAGANIAGGGDTVVFSGGGANNSASLSNTVSAWDAVKSANSGTTGTVYLTNAGANIAGGGETVDFYAGANNSASLINTVSAWDAVKSANGATGTVYLSNAGANIAGGGDTVDFFQGANNSASLINTGSEWDTVKSANGATGAVYLTSAGANIAGGGDTVEFFQSANNSASLINTVSAWDTVKSANGATGTVYLTNAGANIAGGGDTVDFYAGANNSASLINTVSAWDNVKSANGATGTVYLTNAGANITGGGDTIDFYAGANNSASLINTGTAPDTVKSANGATGTVYLTNAKASISGAGDTVDFTGGSENVATLSATDALLFNQTAFGLDTVNGYTSADTLSFNIADQGHLAISQSGASTLITFDAADVVTLTNVSASSLGSITYHS